MRRLAAALAMAAYLLAPGREAAAEGSWRDRLILTGRVETVQSLRMRAPDETLTSRAALRLELGADFETLYGFLSLEGEKNWKIASESGVEPREAWLEHVGRGWDVRIGRQIIIWGKADGVQITDIVSPPDYTESITRDLDEIRMPVDAVKFRLLGKRVDTELIWIPVFKPALRPTGDNPWAVRTSWPETVRVSSRAAREPATTLGNSEIALKLSAYLPGVDVAASLFHTWDDYPAMHRTVRTDGDNLIVNYAPAHHRLTVFGLEGSRPWGDFVFRAETAFYRGRYFETTALDIDPRRKDSLKWLGGVDWTPGNDWTVTGQLIGEHILGHEKVLHERAGSYMATLNVAKKLLRQTLTLSNMLYYRFNDHEFFDRLKVEYAVTDDLQLALGADLFQGAKGPFGRYTDNSQIWLRARYGF